MYYKKLKTVDNNPYFNTESENPILKKDEHHAEIIDITDGLVVDEQTLISPNYSDDNNDSIWYNMKNHSKMNKNSVWNAFSKSKL